MIAMPPATATATIAFATVRSWGRKSAPPAEQRDAEPHREQDLGDEHGNGRPLRLPRRDEHGR